MMLTVSIFTDQEKGFENVILSWQMSVIDLNLEIRTPASNFTLEI